MLTAETVWAITSPENRDKARALGMRLAVAYADGQADRVAALIPADADDNVAKTLQMAFSEAMDVFAAGGVAPPLNDLWADLNQVLDAAPEDIRHQIYRMFHQHVAASESGEFADTIQATVDSPRVTAHLGGAVLAVLALGVSEPTDNGPVSGVERLRRNADRLDPPGR